MTRVRNRNPGDPLAIKASEWNAIAAATNRSTLPVDLRAAGRGAGLAPGVVWVRNDGDDPLERFQVLKLGGMLVDPADQAEDYLARVVLGAVINDQLDLRPGRFALAAETIPPGLIGRAYMTGVFPVLINVDQTGHRYARAVEGDFEVPESLYLESCSAGQIPILTKESGLGVRHAVISLTPATGPLMILAKLLAATVIAPNRWSYTWQEFTRTASTFTEGTRNSTDDGLAYNLGEAYNAATGILGSGIDLANVPGGFAPVPAGTPVVRLSQGDDYTWELEGWTHVDGICEETEGVPEEV